MKSKSSKISTCLKPNVLKLFIFNTKITESNQTKYCKAKTIYNGNNLYTRHNCFIRKANGVNGIFFSYNKI